MATLIGIEFHVLHSTMTTSRLQYEPVQHCTYRGTSFVEHVDSLLSFARSMHALRGVQPFDTVQLKTLFDP